MVKIVFLNVFVLFIAGARAWSQEIIVESTSINEEKIEPSRSSTVITSEDLKLQKVTNVADALNNVPGVTIVKQGGVGQTTSVFIRGARSEDTLVLIDGMDANDAMSPGCGFDFSSMSSENIERIEIYRGPQSVRFGSGALGGVINIITKEGTKDPSVSYLAEAGTYKTNRQVLATYGKKSDLGYSFSVDRYSTSGFSAASEKYGASESDGAEVQSVSGKLGLSLSKTAKIQAALRYTNADIDIDTFGGPGGDDPNNKNKSEQLITGVSGSERFFEDRLKSTLGVYFAKIDRKGRNEPDAANPTDSTDKFVSENRKIQSENELSLGEYSTIRVGLQYRDESGYADTISSGTPLNIDRKSQSIYGGSLTYLFESDTWFFDVGARSDQSSAVNSISSFRTSIGRKFLTTGTKTYLSYGTGYKLPSLYQLHSIYGNQNLKHEDSNTFEITAEQKFAKNSVLTLTAFSNHYQNYIDWDPSPSPGRYYNISKAKSTGFEIQVSSSVTQALTLSGSYSYLETKDDATGFKLLRRPQNSWTAFANYKISDFEIFGQYLNRGEREDLDPALFTRINDPSYDLLSFGGTYEAKAYLKVFARIENAFDKKYEEVAGYGTSGRGFYAGISGDF